MSFPAEESETQEDAPFQRRKPRIGVHALSEYVFCRRAGLLAQGVTLEDRGDEEPLLGPKLDWYGDYDEHYFQERLQAAWNEVWSLLTWGVPLLALGPLLVMNLGRFWGSIWGLALIWMLALPVAYLVVRLWQTGLSISHLQAERSRLRAAVPFELDMQTLHLLEEQDVNWWSLRKAGFECRKPVDPYVDQDEQLTGKPWRVLVHGRTLRIPVLRKHRGKKEIGSQHLVRISAYCHLIESQEGGIAPFGILMFAGSDKCKLIPNRQTTQATFESVLKGFRELLLLNKEQEIIPSAPGDRSCLGCPWGEPEPLPVGMTISQTTINGKAVKVYSAQDNHRRLWHSPCADAFQATPPHANAIHLGLITPPDQLLNE